MKRHSGAWNGAQFGQEIATGILIRERTGEGRERAMANGVVFGREPKLSDFQRNEAIKRRGNGETLSAIAKTY